MNRMCMVALIFIVTSFCWGQNTNASMPAPPATAGQQAGQAVVIPIQLVRSLDSRKLKQGDPVEAKIATELRTSDGTVIARGSKVVGHVTEASARAKGDASSQLGIAFDQIRLKDGKQLPLKASMQAIGPPPGVGQATTEMANPSTMPNSGTSSPMGGMSNPSGMGTQRSTYPSPNSGTAPSPPQPEGQTSPQLTQQSAGVVGLHDLQLEQGSILASSGKEVKLEAGSEILLRVQNQ